VMSDLRVP